MIDKPDRTSVLSRTLEILQKRGWAAAWSTDDDSPLNIRSAVAKACTQLVGHGDALAWHNLYLDAVHDIGVHLKTGVNAWEAMAKSAAQVEAMLTEVINRLENDDIKPRASRRRTRPTGL